MTRPGPMALEALETPPADNVSWWDAFENYLTAGHTWEEAAKLAHREIEEAHK